MNRDAMRSLLIVLGAWVVVAGVGGYLLTHFLQRQGPDPHFDIPIYSGATSVRQEGSADIRSRRVTYDLDTRPPATAVLEFYSSQLATRGWRATKRTRKLGWQHMAGTPPVDVLWREWLTEDELLRFDLYLAYRRGVGAMPGRMTVNIEVGRNLPVVPRGKPAD
jgi:hypothetical protein